MPDPSTLLQRPDDQPSVPVAESLSTGSRGRILILGLLGLLVLFAWPLLSWVRVALAGGLHSYLLLIPAVTAYFLWLQRDHLAFSRTPDWPVAAPAAIGAALLLGAYVLRGSAPLDPVDQVAWLIAPLVLLVWAVAAYGGGRAFLRQNAYALGFLIFMIPLPTPVVAVTETFLQHGSAHAAYGIFRLVGTPVFRDELVFLLPGFSMQVAPQCSGINSSVALFVTAAAAGYLFLRSPWKRALLLLAIVPLALLRNGFRIFVIGELCVRVSPDMVNSWVHKQGGPFFFALSLIPFSLLLWWLYRTDHPSRRSAG